MHWAGARTKQTPRAEKYGTHANIHHACLPPPPCFFPVLVWVLFVWGGISQKCLCTFYVRVRVVLRARFGARGA